MARPTERLFVNDLKVINMLLLRSKPGASNNLNPLRNPAASTLAASSPVYDIKAYAESNSVR